MIGEVIENIGKTTGTNSTVVVIGMAVTALILASFLVYRTRKGV